MISYGVVVRPCYNLWETITHAKSSPHGDDRLHENYCDCSGWRHPGTATISPVHTTITDDGGKRQNVIISSVWDAPHTTLLEGASSVTNYESHTWPDTQIINFRKKLQDLARRSSSMKGAVPGRAAYFHWWIHSIGVEKIPEKSTRPQHTICIVT